MLEGEVWCAIDMIHEAAWCAYQDVDLARTALQTKSTLYPGIIDRKASTNLEDLSAMSWDCSCEKECCPVAVPIYLSLSTVQQAMRRMFTLSPRPRLMASNVSLTCVTRSRVGNTTRARSRVTTREDRI